MKKDEPILKTFRIPDTGIPHYVQGQGTVKPGGTYRATHALADGDIDVEAELKAEAKRKAEAERLAAEQAEAERIAAEKAEADRLAAEQAGKK